MDLIVGGTGSLGREAVRRLLAAGGNVRVMTRSPQKAGDLKRAGAEVVQGDLLNKNSLRAACEGADRVLAAAHSLLGRGRQSFMHVDGRGHRDLIDAAKSAGVRQFVYTSAHHFDQAALASPFFRVKEETEQYLRASGIGYTILRPTAFMDIHAHTLIGVPVMNKGKVTIFGKGETPRNFVAASDVARIAILAMTEPSLAGEILEIGGPENLTTMEVVRIYERISGRSARVIHVPLWLPGGVAPLLRPVHTGANQLLRTAIFFETKPQSFDSGSLADRLGIRPVRLEEWALERISSRPLSHTA